MQFLAHSPNMSTATEIVSKCTTRTLMCKYTACTNQQDSRRALRHTAKPVGRSVTTLPNNFEVNHWACRSDETQLTTNTNQQSKCYLRNVWTSVSDLMERHFRTYICSLFSCVVSQLWYKQYMQSQRSYTRSVYLHADAIQIQRAPFRNTYMVIF